MSGLAKVIGWLLMGCVGASVCSILAIMAANKLADLWKLGSKIGLWIAAGRPNREQIIEFMAHNGHKKESKEC